MENAVEGETSFEGFLFPLNVIIDYFSEVNMGQRQSFVRMLEYHRN